MNKALKNKLQNLLPVYLSGGLEKSEIEYFESEIINFPDLQELIRDSQAIYSRIEQIDYDSIFEARSQNLATKAKLKAIENKSKRFWKYALAPIVVLLAVSVYYYSVNNHQSIIPQKEVASVIGVTDDFLDQYADAYISENDVKADETLNVKEDLSDNTNSTDKFFDDVFEKLSESPDLLYRYSGFDLLKITPEKSENYDLDNIIEELQNNEII
jgi:hypothetical protein